MNEGLEGPLIKHEKHAKILHLNIIFLIIWQKEGPWSIRLIFGLKIWKNLKLFIAKEFYPQYKDITP